ncbi:hypothetical protein LOK49_LG09G01181 [Camellia lanceoleosa]|uniref:Uncharacterized protein n=1 Tax=Camellia lanceoleosa TaxID=1840588 RepID=A0ACC0GID6_9ERIC|nr:hypothetical protein LOK49_LG09G01181 [Camellia lanceoleosa]
MKNIQEPLPSPLSGVGSSPGFFIGLDSAVPADSAAPAELIDTRLTPSSHHAEMCYSSSSPICVSSGNSRRVEISTTASNAQI